MSPTLYMLPPSPPVRAVQITAKAIGLQLQEKVVDVLSGENLKPEYLKLNPQHTIPTLDDDGFIIWDSHAINVYLVTTYGKNDALYPKDPKKRAIIDQRLHFDTGVAFPSMGRIVGPILKQGKTKIDDNDKELGNNVYGFVEAFLEGKEWIAGNSVSIADYSLYSTLTSFNFLVPIDAQKYPKLAGWIKKVDGLPEAEAAKKGFASFESLMKSKLS